MLERWRQGDFVALYRSREVQRRNLMIIVGVALGFVLVVVLVLLTTDPDADSDTTRLTRPSTSAMRL